MILFAFEIFDQIKSRLMANPLKTKQKKSFSSNQSKWQTHYVLLPPLLFFVALHYYSVHYVLGSKPDLLTSLLLHTYLLNLNLLDATLDCKGSTHNPWVSIGQPVQLSYIHLDYLYVHFPLLHNIIQTLTLSTCGVCVCLYRKQEF